MKIFVVSFIDFFDYAMDIQKIKAPTAADALCGYLVAHRGANINEIPEEVEDIRRYVADNDAAIAYMEV